MADRPLRLLTLNIRMGAGGGALARPAYDIPASPRRDAALARAIQAAGADVVALQEVRNARHARVLADRLQTGFVYAPHPASYSLDFFEWGLALLTRFAVRRRGTFALFFDPELRAGRIGLWAEIMVGEQPVAVINVHLETRRPAAQLEALQKQVAATALPLIVMGDFNRAADDPAMDPLRRTLTDTCRAAATPASREAEAVGTLAGTRRRIDAIYLAGDRFRTCEAGLLAAEHRGVSDHIGYYAEVLLRPPADHGGA